MRARLLLVLLFLALPLHAQLDFESWDVAAMRTTRTAPIQLTARASATSNITAMRLDLAAGSSITLTPLGSGVFRASVTPAQALFGYDARDVNRNFVGYLRLLAGSQVIATYNEFVNVIDANIPGVAVKNLSATARQSPRILNVLLPPGNTADSELQPAVQRLYTYLPDDFDFVQVVFSLPKSSGNRYHIGVRNDATGTGLGPNNSTAVYGSAGRLLGINVFPLDNYFDCAEVAFSHETGHQWINFLKNPRLAAGSPHWPYSNLASGVMGFSLAGDGAGGDFSWSVESAGPGLARVRALPASQPKGFSDLDLYLMGLLPPAQVRDALVLDGAPTCSVECTMPATTVTIQDVITTNGPRIPTSSTSQKSFRFATVIVTHDRLLTDDEMAFFDYFAARGEAKVVLPFAIGLQQGTTNPFYLATRGLATADLRLTPPPALKRRTIKR
ncbi:MAG: hypothetical protein JOZ54_04455 [Acidobacteria bacterium]|nr:hypothetical protein [Acidobacteriota bacterium]